jgi:DNA-binding NtrC family response regulator
MSKRASAKAKLLLVDDNPDFLEIAIGILEDTFVCVGVSNPEEVVDACSAEDPDAVLLDLDFDGKPLGFEILSNILAKDPFMPIIMWTDSDDLKDAIEAVKRGAFYYVVKAARPGAIEVVVESALRHRRALVENAVLRAEIDREWGEFIYASDVMERIFREVEKIAPRRYPVLITGETGVGKGLMAREIHRRSGLPEDRFVPFDCSVQQPALVGDALFGHVKGSFTGADSNVSGYFEAASGGTLFLDEIGDMLPEAQTSLLRLAAEGEVTRIGAKESRKVNVRIIAATNRDLSGGPGEKPLREDLYRRINTLPIHIPPLRERREDITPLARHFVARCSEELDAEYVLSESALRFLRAQDWPGNVRGLRNAIERACVLAEGPVLQPQDFASAAETSVPAGTYEEAKAKILIDFKRAYFLELLRRNDWNVAKAAREAGVSRTGLHKIMKELGIEKPKSNGGPDDDPSSSGEA